jgi:predicted enzyme related to lactoylglutathione lyase
MTTDAPAAEAFYGKVVGWRAADAGMTGMRYTLLSVGETAIAGLMGLSDEACAAGAPPGWVGYVAVDDVDAHAQRVKQAGGAVHHGPEDIPGVGRFAMVADPQGAGFALFKGSSPERPPQPAPGKPGTIGWHELHAGDGVAAFAYYANQFGWTKDRAMDMGPLGTYQLFATGGEACGGMMTKTADTPAPGWLFYVNVESIDAAISRVNDKGGRVIMGPHQVPTGSWIAQCLDPQGAMFAMVAAQR